MHACCNLSKLWRRLRRLDEPNKVQTLPLMIDNNGKVHVKRWGEDNLEGMAHGDQSWPLVG